MLESQTTNWFLIIGVLGGVLFMMFMTMLIPMLFRKVVSANEVHVVQAAKKTIAYGRNVVDEDGKPTGNVYYKWPTWVPLLGVEVKSMPVSIFNITLKGYDAFDKGRLPFLVDIVAFFRIFDYAQAAQRVESIRELEEQLTTIVQGAVRSILAKSEIENIMEERAIFGSLFTQEVSEQLKSWGVEAVKNIELMNVLDAPKSEIIHNITAKKKSHLEMESRLEVAKNAKNAEVAEIEARREIDLGKAEAEQTVGLRNVESRRLVELAEAAKQQALSEQEKITTEKRMEVEKVQRTKQAEIARDVAFVTADQNKEVALKKADQDKKTAVASAEATFESRKMEAEAIKLKGTAEADAKKAMEMAPVTAQIELAEKIGQNEKYQQYLISIRQIEANQAIGVEQAKAIETSDIKIIANTGSISEGIKSVSELFTPKGGTAVGSMIEGLMNTEAGAALLKNFGVATDSTKQQ